MKKHVLYHIIIFGSDSRNSRDRRQILYSKNTDKFRISYWEFQREQTRNVKKKISQFILNILKYIHQYIYLNMVFY